MSTVKITDLPFITYLQPNTANTVLVGVDLPSDDTGQITLTTLARGLYSNNFLYVGNNDILLANAVGQFTGNANPYLQVSLHNNDANGSGDFVVTGDVGTDTINFIDLGIQGSTLSQGVLLPTDGYLLMVGDTSTSPGGNLIIGTDTPNKNIDVILGGHETNNVAAQFLYGQGFKLTQKPLIFADGTSQNSAVAYTGVDSRVSANVATINGSITANATSANSVINTRITANIATANIFTQAAFDKANNALANTTGTFNGKLTTTNGLDSNGLISISNSTFGATQSLVTISASNTGYSQTPAVDGYILHLTGKHNTPTRIISDSFGANGQLVYPAFVGRAARGNVTNPSAVQTDDILARFSGSSFGSTGYQVGGTARIDIIATENHSDSSRGSAIKFFNVMSGTNTIQNIATFNADDVTFSGAVQPQKGFIYTPRVLPGAQTAITINYSSDSIIRANLSADLVVSHSNFTTGKVVEMWLLNTSGLTRTITHGVSAQNSTLNSTTFTMPSTSSAYLKFFSIDGDLANTFVSVQHA